MADSKPTTPAAAATGTKPTRPDEALFNEQLAKVEREYAEVMTRYVS